MVTEKTGKKWIKPGNGQPLLVSCYCGDLGLSGHCSRPWHSGCKASCKSSCVWWRKWRVCSGVQEVWSIIARDGPTRKRTWEVVEASMMRWEGAGHTEAESAFPCFSDLSIYPAPPAGPGTQGDQSCWTLGTPVHFFPLLHSPPKNNCRMPMALTHYFSGADDEPRVLCRLGKYSISEPQSSSKPKSNPYGCC